MTLLNTIKAVSLEARKARDTDKAALLTTLLGDAMMVGKNNGNRESTDAEVIAVIKKFINNANEVLEILKKSHQSGVVCEYISSDHNIPLSPVEQLHLDSITLLESFLPKQLSQEDLSSVIDILITTHKASSIKDMGNIMKQLKAVYEGTYDGATASALIKGKLS